MKYQSLRGTKDILPEESRIWQYVEKQIHQTFQSTGFTEIRTPIFEQTELFTRTIGDGTDIVSKEMYTFIDKGDRSVTLRPEATAAVVRAVIENNLINSQSKDLMLYYIGPMFRYERPQAGRQRQFNQAGIELFGSDSFMADVVVIITALMLFEKLGIKGLEININSVGCDVCRPGYLEIFKNYLNKNVSKLCPECQVRYEKNPLRILDCKNPSCKDVLKTAPSLKDHVCENCTDHLEKIVKELAKAGFKTTINDHLVRGLDYYSKTTFEIVSNDLGAQNAICGGGRYDSLLEKLGGSKSPAVGMALGMERLISLLPEETKQKAKEGSQTLYIIAMGNEAVSKASEIQRQLLSEREKKSNIIINLDPNRSIKSQFKTANDINADHVLIIGENELKKDIYQLKNMKTGEQKEITLKNIIEGNFE